MLHRHPIRIGKEEDEEINRTQVQYTAFTNYELTRMEEVMFLFSLSSKKLCSRYALKH